MTAPVTVYCEECALPLGPGDAVLEGVHWLCRACAEPVQDEAEVA